MLTYDQIYEKVWGDFSSGSERETIGFHVRNLRKKLFDTDQEPAYQIESIRDVWLSVSCIIKTFQAAVYFIGLLLFLILQKIFRAIFQRFSIFCVGMTDCFHILSELAIFLGVISAFSR